MRQEQAGEGKEGGVFAAAVKTKLNRSSHATPHPPVLTLAAVSGAPRRGSSSTNSVAHMQPT